MAERQRAMASLEMITTAFDRSFWEGKRVFLTGHTGFKGAWLTLWLQSLGAKVCGVALEPDTEPNLFVKLGLIGLIDRHIVEDIRNAAPLQSHMADFKPDIAIHMAAQPLVRRSYREPDSTFAVNVQGTVNFLEACRVAMPRVILIVTSDKVYENREWLYSYRESDRLGGFDPYSASKACAEIVTKSYRQSFFVDGQILLASARAGNVFGGGDWSEDRLIPDAVRAANLGTALVVRNPDALRPWQHVLDALSGYMTLVAQLWLGKNRLASAWNFGPSEDQIYPVRQVADAFAAAWGEGASWRVVPQHGAQHEAGLLLLNSGLANRELGWRPRLTFPKAMEFTATWYKAAYSGMEPAGLRAFSLAQIESLFAS